MARKALSCGFPFLSRWCFSGVVPLASCFLFDFLVHCCRVVSRELSLPLVWYTGAVLFLFSNFAERGVILC